jgi:hypothetical protein
MGEWMYRSTYPRHQVVSGQLHATVALALGKSPRDPLDRRLVAATAVLDDVEERKTLSYRDSNSDPSAFQPVANHYTD